jgi:hypothetical protein
LFEALVEAAFLFKYLLKTRAIYVLRSGSLKRGCTELYDGIFHLKIREVDQPQRLPEVGVLLHLASTIGLVA